MIGPHKILSNPPSKFLAWPSLNLVMHTAIANLFVMQCWPLTGPAEEGGNRWLFANASDCEMDDALCDHNHKLPPADFCTHRQTLISSIRVSLQGPGGDDYICPPAGRYDSSVSGDGPMYLQWVHLDSIHGLALITLYNAFHHLLPEIIFPPRKIPPEP